MFCKYCGKEIDSDSIYCEGCGKRLKESSEPKTETPPKEPEHKPNETRATSSAKTATEVNFIEAIRLYYSNAFNFEGRATRSEYWWIVLFNISISLLISFSGCVLGLLLATGTSPDTIDAVTLLIQLISFAWGIANFIPGLSLCIRRLHDIDKSGWWYLISFIPLVQFVLIYWFCLPSDGDNQWGPVPSHTTENYDDPFDTPPRKTAEEYPSNLWWCECGRKNYGDTCQNCGAVKETVPEGKWKCMGCGEYVSNETSICSCGYHRIRANSRYHCAKCGFSYSFETNCPNCGSSVKKYH